MTVLREWWRRFFLHAEFGVAIGGAAAFVVWAERFGGTAGIDLVLQNNRGALYGTLASIFGSLLGFAVTATSIVLGFSSSPSLRIVRESVHYPTLWRVFLATIRTLGFATVVSLVGLVFDRDDAPWHWVLYFVVLAFSLSCLRIARSVWVLERVIGLVTKAQRGAEH